MTSLRRMAAVLTFLSVAALVALGLSTGASAAPYPPAGGEVSVSSTTVAPGGTVTVQGTGFLPGEQVSVDLHSDVVHLATVTADNSGVATATVTIPTYFSGPHYITLTGLTSGKVERVDIRIESGSNNNGDNNNGGNNIGGNNGAGNNGAGNNGGSSNGANGSSGDNGNGGLAYTGVAVIGGVAVAGGLLAFGAMMMLGGRRRRTTAV